MSMFSLFSIFLVGFLSTSQFVVTLLLTDQAALLAIVKEFNINGFNGSSSDYCSWPAVSCTSNNSFVERVDLSNHGLQGNSSLFSEFRNLKFLDLSHNNFHGIIPPSFGNLYDLEFLDLSFNNFRGSIPLELGRLKNLGALNLSNNLIMGMIPDELEDLEKIEELQLFTNRLNGSIPMWIGKLTNLKVFTAYENELSGVIPEILGSHSELQLLNLHSNRLEGSIPMSIFAMGKLETLVLTQNRLSGYIPVSIGNCKLLWSIRLGNNNLIGSIPSEIGDVSGLTYFEADNNNLSGEIVSEFSQCSNLTLLNLASNGFTGTLPVELGLLASLQELIVSGNSLFGEIPLSILNNINKLDLSNNRFNGTIPESICASSKLQFLLLGQNSIRGVIPHGIGNCVKLLELQLGSNYLTGSIPPEMGRIKNLQISLNLSFNHLQGNLPDELGRLDKLVSFDVANNQLSGKIPSSLKGMLSLIEVNFSNNQFDGEIPSFAPFQKSLNSSFLGNIALCGQPLSKSCARKGLDENSRNYYHHKVSYRIVLAVIGSGLAVFTSVTVVVMLFLARENQEKAAASKNEEKKEISDQTSGYKRLILAGNVFAENLNQAIDFNAIGEAAAKDSNKLSTGTFSTVYKVEMPSGMVLSIRELKLMDKVLIHHQNRMMRESEKLSKLCHDNLMKPIGFVIFEDGVLLLHQYYPNGTLANFLHDSPNQMDYKPDWPARLAIAIGVANGLAFLHDNVGIIHLDISSSNVALDDNFHPLVGEIEISKLFDPSRGAASISTVAGSFGYIPPEYAYTMQVTAPGNVYSYGVVLLEILTSRLPVDEEAFGDGNDLVKWVHTAPTRGETPEQILDPRLSTISFACRKQMLATLKVALLCTDANPAKRPKMNKVVEMLREIVPN